MESVLSEIMFWGPGSAIRFCLVDEKFVREQKPHQAHNSEKSLMPRCWSRGQGRMFEEAWEKEEEGWKRAREEVVLGDGDGEEGSFERLREAGSSGM